MCVESRRYWVMTETWRARMSVTVYVSRHLGLAVMHGAVEAQGQQYPDKSH